MLLEIISQFIIIYDNYKYIFNLILTMYNGVHSFDNISKYSITTSVFSIFVIPLIPIFMHKSGIYIQINNMYHIQ